MNLRPFLFLLAASLGFAATDETAKSKAHSLVWDAMEKTIHAKAGETAAEFEFSVTNKSDQQVEIRELNTSCGCTVADMPATPWILAPGASGSFRAVVDFSGKHGELSKSVFVVSNLGTQVLRLTVNIPMPDEATRQRNQQLALADRQAVFRGECASCHRKPAIGKTGAELFHAACAICHLAPHRASMVPDLMVAREPRDEAYWRKWISEGKEGTLMPAFAEEHGGPLSEEQIRSLVEFAFASLPGEPRKE